MTEVVQMSEKAPPRSSNASLWLRVTRAAAFTVGLWSVALQITAGTVIPPVAFYGVVFAGLGVFLTGERRKLALAVAVLAVLALLGNLPGTIDELSHPDSAPAFILTLLVTLAAFVAAIAGLAAFRGWSADAIRPTLIIWTSLFGLGLIVALTASSRVDSVSAQSSDVRVVAAGVEFDQSELLVAAGTSGFWIDNQDGIRHTFTIEVLGLEIDVPAMSAQRAEFELDSGQYVVFCAVPGHENMKIDLTVEG